MENQPQVQQDSRVISNEPSAEQIHAEDVAANSAGEASSEVAVDPALPGSDKTVEVEAPLNEEQKAINDGEILAEQQAAAASEAPAADLSNAVQQPLGAEVATEDEKEQEEKEIQRQIKEKKSRERLQYLGKVCLYDHGVQSADKKTIEVETYAAQITDIDVETGVASLVVLHPDKAFSKQHVQYAKSTEEQKPGTWYFKEE